MQNFATVKRSEPPDDLYENIPNFLLFDVGFSLLVAGDLLVQIPIISILHDEAETRR